MTYQVCLKFKPMLVRNFDKLWDEYKRVLNPQHYPVDLARDVWQDKMDLIDKMRKEALGEGEEE